YFARAEIDGDLYQRHGHRRIAIVVAEAPPPGTSRLRIPPFASAQASQLSAERGGACRSPRWIRCEAREQQRVDLGTHTGRRRLAGEAEVDELRGVRIATARAPDDVRGLDIAMHEAAEVCLVERSAHLHEDVDHSADWLRTELPDELIEIDAVEIFHRVVEHA